MYQKNDTPLACSNVNLHKLILTVFGRNVTERVTKQLMIYFPNLPN